MERAFPKLMCPPRIVFASQLRAEMMPRVGYDKHATTLDPNVYRQMFLDTVRAIHYSNNWPAIVEFRNRQFAVEGFSKLVLAQIKTEFNKMSKFKDNVEEVDRFWNLSKTFFVIQDWYLHGWNHMNYVAFITFFSQRLYDIYIGFCSLRQFEKIQIDEQPSFHSELRAVSEYSDLKRQKDVTNPDGADRIVAYLIQVKQILPTMVGHLNKIPENLVEKYTDTVVRISNLVWECMLEIGCDFYNDVSPDGKLVTDTGYKWTEQGLKRLDQRKMYYLSLQSKTDSKTESKLENNQGKNEPESKVESI